WRPSASSGAHSTPWNRRKRSTYSSPGSRTRQATPSSCAKSTTPCRERTDADRPPNPGATRIPTVSRLLPAPASPAGEHLCAALVCLPLEGLEVALGYDRLLWAQ